MKLKILFILALAFQLMACVHTESDHVIRPETVLYNQGLTQDDFVKLGRIYKNDPVLWQENTPHTYPIGVSLIEDDLMLAFSIQTNPYYFDLEDGKLQTINNGEFGGALNFIPQDQTLDTISIMTAPPSFIFEYNEKIYFAFSFRIPYDSGLVVEMIRNKDSFTYKEVVDLGISPEAMTIYEDQIIFAGNGKIEILTPKRFSRRSNTLEEFEKRFIHGDDLLNSYINSIAVKNEDEIYLGMRNGYAKLSLVSDEIEAYIYKESISSEGLYDIQIW